MLTALKPGVQRFRTQGGFGYKTNLKQLVLTSQFRYALFESVKPATPATSIIISISVGVQNYFF
jgi:hypothetical protein